jgi:hypothetical protein
MNTAACLRPDGDASAAAEMAAGDFGRLPVPYRDGLVRSRVQGLHHALDGRSRGLLGQSLACAIAVHGRGPRPGGPQSSLPVWSSMVALGRLVPRR